MNLPSIREITDKAQSAFKRFPVTLVWAILGSFYMIYLIGHGNQSRFEQNLDVLLTLILGVSWLIATQFLVEQQERPKKWVWVKAIVLILLVLFYWHLPSVDKLDDNPTYLVRFFLYLIGGHLFLLFAPFTKSWDKAAYWNYLKSVGTAIGRSGVFSGILYLGLVLALVAIDALFEVHIPGDYYGQLFIFCLGIVNTWIYLSDFPKNILQHTEIHFDKALEVFVKYILIPLVLLYIVILYAYGFKILIEWELPKGWVSYLVTALALLGFVVQVLINPVQKTAKAWTIHRFYPWFYYALLPLIVLLFVAISRRVADYGITENRYFVLLVAFWILAMSLYLLFVKKKRLIVLPISLFVLALLCSFGPWGAFKLSTNSQVRQFEKVFKTVVKNDKKANSEQFEQLKSVMDFLDKRESISKLDGITGFAMEEALKDTTNTDWKSYRWLDSGKILDSLGITISQEELNKGPYGTYYSYYNDQSKARDYDISEFSYFSPINFSSYNIQKNKIGRFEFSFDPNTVSISLYAKNDSIKVIQIPLKKKLMALSKYGNQLYNVDEKELMLKSENDSIMVQLIFTNLGYNIQQDSINISSSNAFMFLKEK